MNKQNTLIMIALKASLILTMAMFIIVNTWIYLPQTPIYKAIVSVVFALITWDLLKNYIYTRYVVWKEGKNE